MNKYKYLNFTGITMTMMTITISMIMTPIGGFSVDSGRTDNVHCLAPSAQLTPAPQQS